MNILDFKADDINGKKVLHEMFKVVENLFYNFYKDFQPTVKDLEVPISIDTYEGQLAIKDYFMLRVNEELCELLEAIKEKDRIEHVHEEVADSINFLLNGYVLYGWDDSKFEPIESLWQRFNKEKINWDKVNFTIVKDYVSSIIYQIGITMNKLKIRQWRKTQYLVDILVFEERFEKIYYKFIDLIFYLNIHPEMLWSIFSRKNKCNDFRLATNY